MSLDSTARKEFARLIARYQREVQGYIFTIVPRWADTDEIWQETSVRLWEEFDKYEPGTNFAAWAIRIAHYEVLTWRKKVSRSRLIFDQEFVDAIAIEQDHFVSDESRERLAMLDECLEEVDARKRQFLARFYSPNMRVKEIALEMKCSAEAVYKIVQRVRWALRQCMERQTKEEKLT